jgi:uncharacterized protein YndB with AHSA1/START domain
MSDAITTGDAVVIERHFDAPVEVLWQMWTDPNDFSAWYGPDGATVSVLEWDLRVGGARLIRMTAPTPNGAMDMWFAGEFLDVLENTRLIYTEYMSDDSGTPLLGPHGAMPTALPATEVQVELAEVGGRTRIVMTHRGIPADSPGAAGWTMALDKLAVHLRESLP